MPELLNLLISSIKIGLGAFGGGSASFLLMYREFHFEGLADNITIGSMLPGPLAVVTMALNGYRVAGLPGSAVAVFGVILPAVFLVSAVIFVLVKFSDNRLLKVIRYSIQPGALALIVAAVYTIGSDRIGPLLTGPDASAGKGAIAIIMSAAVFGLLVWRGSKLNPALVILAMGLLGIFLF